MSPNVQAVFHQFARQQAALKSLSSKRKAYHTTFSLTDEDEEVIAELQEKLSEHHLTKSEVVRLALCHLSAIPDCFLTKKVNQLPRIPRGRPSKRR